MISFSGQSFVSFFGEIIHYCIVIAVYDLLQQRPDIIYVNCIYRCRIIQIMHWVVLDTWGHALLFNNGIKYTKLIDIP